MKVFPETLNFLGFFFFLGLTCKKKKTAFIKLIVK